MYSYLGDTSLETYTGLARFQFGLAGVWRYDSGNTEIKDVIAWMEQT